VIQRHSGIPKACVFALRPEDMLMPSIIGHVIQYDIPLVL
jgi:hypothetical protein